MKTEDRVRFYVNESTEYQDYFKKELKKTGKKITDMSKEEKKEFFNKVDSGWKGKNESYTTISSITEAFTRTNSDGVDILYSLKNLINSFYSNISNGSDVDITVLKTIETDLAKFKKTLKKFNNKEEYLATINESYKLNESPSTPAEKHVEKFIKSLTVKYGYSVEDAVYLVKTTISKMGLNEVVSGKKLINEITVKRIPNFNLESDAYILMLDILKNNSAFKKNAISAGIELYTGANKKSVFTVLHNKLKKVITPQDIKLVIMLMNRKRKVLFVNDYDIDNGVHTHKFAGILALGLIDSFTDSPIDYDLIRDLGSPKLKKLADELAISRGAREIW